MSRRLLAPTGKDAGRKVCLWHIDDRGRRRSVISGRLVPCVFAEPATSAMQFDHAFAVAAPIDAVWTTITDIGRVAPCVPDTRVTGQTGPDSYDVEITAAVGPLQITAQGNIKLVERDGAARRAVLEVVANDADGDRLADATVTIVLTATGERTDGAVRSSVDLGAIGVLVGEDKLGQVAGTTLAAFASNLEALLRRRARHAAA